ncbi:MAG: hypothetical protein HKN04_06755 [Rhodothermaceae bacterium]|nr:hypothetical protein [Rhodothermaceae bacterium]
MSDGLPKLLSTCWGGGSAAEMIDHLVAAAHGWAQNQPTDGDMMFLVLRRKPDGAATA